MRSALALCLLAALTACRTSRLGACTSDAQCPQGATCDAAAAVCVAKPGTCLPACDAAHLCNPTTLACDAVTTPQVAVVSPVQGALVSGTLHASATARAPGGISAVRFELRSTGGALLASGAGAAAGAATWTASIALAGVADGAVLLSAVATYPQGTVTSAAVSVTVDQTPPVISLQTDGRTAFFGAGQTATPVAQITDAISGVQDSTVALLISGHAAVAGVPGAGGTYSFPVLLDDSIVAAGASATVAFQLVAANKAGQTATLSGNPAEVIQADRDAPAIAGINYTPAAFASPLNHLVLGGPASGSVTLQATITDGASVTALCLRLAGETGACQHPASGTGPVYTFSLPRPAAPQDGTAATTFTLEADDTLAASLSGSSKLEHQTRSAQTVYFDYAGPSISISADSTPYARTAAPIPVSAFIADPSGVPDGGVFLNGALAPASRDGGLFLFQLDPRSAPAGVEGAYNFQISAKDNVNNGADAGGTRVIDGAPPTLTLQIYRDVPDGGGVTYPAAVAGTGWDGTQFIYSDTVHLKGALTDLSGIGAASAHIDGTDVDGGVTRGTPISLGCTTGQSPCAFDVQVALNASGNGAFNSRAAMHPMGDINAPSAPLQVVVDAVDFAHAANGADAGNPGTSTASAQTTRLLWQMYLSASVSGLGVHPDGDLIVTLDGGADTVVAIRPDDGGVDWSWGSSVSMGAIDGTPAIGSGTASTAPVYVAGESGEVYAIAPTGAATWHNSTGDTLNVGPAVFSATIATVTVDEVIVDGALNNKNTTSSIYGIVNGNQISSTAVADANNSSAPFILNGSVYYGTDRSIARHTLSSTTGALGAASDSTGSLNSTNYFEVITNGANLFAWRLGTNGLVSSDPAFTFRWTKGATPTGAPALGLNNNFLIVPLAGGPVDSYDPANGNNTQLLTLGNNSGRAPLLGWDGIHAHLYFPRLSAVLFAYDTAGNLSWEADPNGTTYRATTMDCAGRLFGATNALAGGKSLVYALITDDRGLADTPWPSYRLDARNTGNVGATSGILKSGGTCTQ